MRISGPTQFISTDNLVITRNALSTLFAAMDTTTGVLPYCGYPLNSYTGPPTSPRGCDTYRMWTLIDTHNYFLYSGDIDWLQDV
jgi:hypothetical protein